MIAALAMPLTDALAVSDEGKSPPRWNIALTRSRSGIHRESAAPPNGHRTIPLPNPSGLPATRVPGANYTGSCCCL